MSAIVEAVPNLSEARNTEVVDRLADAADSVLGSRLLHRTSDVDHARTVLTLAGAPASVTRSMEAVTAIAVETIDMRLQRGVHPRIGAVDVVPFVPLEGASMAPTVEQARAFAAAIAERHELPVYLYAEAATVPARRVLADIRRPGFEGLAAWMAMPEGRPDFGPPRPHPTAGATVVGARPVLIAWNIQLRTPDVAIARRIAAAIRERDGGIPGVQALGFLLDGGGAGVSVAQVSMNILDHHRAPLWLVWERVRELAAANGTSIADSELIGLLPRAALASVVERAGLQAADPDELLLEAAAWLRIRDFTLDRVLEIRLRERLTAS